MKKYDNLILPIYLNEEIVIDMLAIIEDGFSMVSNFSSNIVENKEKNAIIDESASIDGLLRKILKISVDGSIGISSNVNKEEITKKDKYHTMTSLFSKFRSYLIEKNRISFFETGNEIQNIKPGDFVEVSGIMERNPLIKILEDFIESYQFSKLFDNSNKENGKRRQNDELLKQIKGFLEKMKISGTEELIIKGDVSVVMSAQEKYLFKENMYELIGGEYKVLGKVAKIYTNENVNLLRKTPLAIVPKGQMDVFVAGLKNSGIEKYNFPDLETEVKAPALLIIPIAIFL